MEKPSEIGLQESTEPYERFSPTQTIAIAAIIVAAVLTFPFAALPLGPPGIDSGWQWVVNSAAENSWIFGQDVVFTYGPLGWLATPQDVGHNLLLANVFRLTLHGFLIVSGLLVLARTRRWIPVLVFASLWTIAGAVGLRFEGSVFLVVALLMMLSISLGTRWPALAAGVTAAVVLFVKTSLGITTAATVFVGASIIWKHRGPKIPLLTATLFGITTAILATIHFPSLPVFQAWIGQSLEVVDGYAAAASIIGPRATLISAIGLLLGMIVGGTLLTIKTRQFSSTALILAPGLLITFRLAFVRQDGHQFLFVPFLVGLLAVAALGTSRRSALTLLAGGLTIVVVGTLSGALPFGPRALPRVITLGHRGPSNLARLVGIEETRTALRKRSHHNLEPLKLPDSWVNQLKTAPNGVTVIPWELMYAPANNLPFKPLRSMQLYSAYTPVLDQITAQGLVGNQAPDFVLDDFAPVGKRRALLDAPATWRTLFVEYQLERSARDRALLLLSKRREPLKFRWLEKGTATLEVGGPGIAVPRSPHMVFAEIDAPLNLLGRLNKTFFRVPLLMAVFHRIDGTRSWTRLIPANAPEGILVSHFPHFIDDYAGLWSGRKPVTVTRLQVVGPGSSSYQRHFNVRWRALETKENLR